MQRVLVAGATGALGREVTKVLKERGHWVRALCRSADRAKNLPADEVTVADALQPASLANAVAGMDAIFSCLGQTVSADMSIRRPGYREVDIPANLNLLTAAKQANARRFVYVSVFHADSHPKVAYLDAHASVAAAVKGSGIEYGIVEPTGFFSAYRAIFEMARTNQAILFGDGQSRSNPIHDRDLAEVCADTIVDTNSAVVQAGGPAVHTRRELFEIAFRALRKPVRIRQVPQWVPGAVAPMIGLFAPRIGDMMSFLQVLSSQDFIAPRKGERWLEDYFQELAAGYAEEIR